MDNEKNNDSLYNSDTPFLTVHTAYDLTLTKALLKFQLKQLLWVYIVFPAFMIIMGIVFLCIDADLLLPQGLMLIIIGLIFPFFTWSLTLLMQKRLDKSQKLLSNDTKIVYEFYGSYFKQTVDKGNDLTDVAKIAYNMLAKVFHTKSHYFLYASSMQAFVVTAKDMSESQKFMLNDIFDKYLGKKFKIV